MGAGSVAGTKQIEAQMMTVALKSRRRDVPMIVSRLSLTRMVCPDDVTDRAHRCVCQCPWRPTTTACSRPGTIAFIGAEESAEAGVQVSQR
jgi:hypothetical protein